jgi:MoxR-like ATPase
MRRKALLIVTVQKPSRTDYTACRKMSIQPEKLDHYLKLNYNVLLYGRHGVGKTGIARETFERNSIRWKYFSAATMDPYINFVGIPKPMTDQEGRDYLESILPREFATDEIEVVFFDELNRAPKAVLNAVMEFIQFRSINGRKFNNLRCIWAAINPKDAGKYHVEDLDEAQEDRFNIFLEVPFEADMNYMVRMHGTQGRAAVMWWRDLKEQRELISPRRLDMMVQAFKDGCDVRETLKPSQRSININKLINDLSRGPIRDKLVQVLQVNDTDTAIKLMKSENDYSASLEHILTDQTLRSYYIPVMPEEKIASLLIKPEVRNSIIPLIESNPRLTSTVDEYIKSNSNPSVAAALRKEIREYYIPLGNTALVEQICVKKNIAKPYYNSAQTEQVFKTFISRGASNYNTQERRKLFEGIAYFIPQTLSPEVAAEAVKLIKSSILSRSQSVTLKKLHNEFKLVNILNHLFDCLNPNGARKWADIEKEHDFRLRDFYDYLNYSGLDHLFAPEL